jgi:hypothetical protein
MERGYGVTEGVEIFPAEMGRQEMRTEFLCGNSVSSTLRRYTNKETGKCIYYVYGGRDGAVGIATRYGLDGPGFEPRWGRDFLDPSTPATRRSQPPVEWVPGLRPGGRRAGAWCWPPTPF